MTINCTSVPEQKTGLLSWVTLLTGINFKNSLKGKHKSRQEIAEYQYDNDNYN